MLKMQVLATHRLISTAIIIFMFFLCQSSLKILLSQQTGKKTKRPNINLPAKLITRSGILKAIL